MRFSAPVIAVLVALVLTVAFWFLLYQPASDQEDEVLAETESLNQQAAQLQVEIDSLRDIEARQVEIRAAMARLEEFIPAGTAQPTAIRQFQRAADAAGTQIATVTFGQPSPATVTGDTGDPATALASIPVTMGVEGGYFQLVDFFRRLEVDVPRAVLVETLAVSEADAQFPTLQVNWTGQMFAVLNQADLGVAPVEPEAPEAPATEAPEGGES